MVLHNHDREVLAGHYETVGICIENDMDCCTKHMMNVCISNDDSNENVQGSWAVTDMDVHTPGNMYT